MDKTDGEKRVQRQAGIAARQGLDAARRQEDNERICASLLESPQYRAARTILLYTAVRGEVDLTAFACGAERDGKRLCYPVCFPEHRMDALHPWDKDAWERGQYGIPAPVRQRSDLIAPEEIDLVLVPCTRFDAQCRRLGMGGGYYDRYLPRCSRAVTVGVAYECQRAERVICGEWDILPDFFVTEKQWYRRGRGEKPAPLKQEYDMSATR